MYLTSDTDFWPVMITVTAWNWRKSSVPCCQCNIERLILLADYRTFRKYITFQHNYSYNTPYLRMPFSMVTAYHGYNTGMVSTTAKRHNIPETYNMKCASWCCVTILCNGCYNEITQLLTYNMPLSYTLRRTERSMEHRA